MSLVVSYFGLEKTGKTTFGFSAIKTYPDGIMVHFDFDLGRERAIWRFPQSLADRIRSVEFPEIPTWTLGSYAITKQWAEFERIYEMALNDTNVRAIFIDTATQMHRLNADEYLENYVKRNRKERHQLSQIEYRIPNSRTRAKIMAARSAGKDLILAHYEGDVYQEQFVPQVDGSLKKESIKTGAKVLAGFSETPYLANYHLQLTLRNVNVDPVTGKGLNPVKLKTFARILTPNPQSAFGVEIPEPTYEALLRTIEALKQAEIGGQQ